MANYNYVAVDAQGQQTRGQLQAADANDLKQQLNMQQLFLVSCHELAPTAPAEPEPAPVASAPAAAPAERKIDEKEWPIKGTPLYVLLGVIFVACVFLGYLIGR